MSEGHAYLFVSIVPGHELSGTIGSNGDQPAVSQHSRAPSSADIACMPRNEWEQSTPIGEDGDGQQTNHATPNKDDQSNPGNTHDESSLEEESINLMDNIVERFRHRELTKLKALSNIVSILNFNPSRTEQAKDAAVKYYSCMLNEIEALATSAIRWGEHAQQGLQSTREPNSGSVHSREEWNNAAVDELLLQLSHDSRGNKRLSSWDFIDDNDTSISNFDIDGVQSNKKQRVLKKKKRGELETRSVTSPAEPWPYSPEIPKPSSNESRPLEQCLSDSPALSGTTSFEDKPLILTPCSHHCTMYPLLKRTLDAWDQLKSPLVDLSQPKYSLNSMIPRDEITGYPLDNLCHLREFLLSMYHKDPTSPCTLFKSDVSEAYHLLPVHPYWQIKQVNRIDGSLHVDRNCAFGGWASGCNWISFMLLVSWI